MRHLALTALLACSLSWSGCAPPLSEGQMHGLALAQSAQKQLCLLNAGVDPGLVQECLSHTTGSGEECLPNLDPDHGTALQRCLLTEDARIQATQHTAVEQCWTNKVTGFSSCTASTY